MTIGTASTMTAIADVRRFESEMLEYFRSEQRDLLGDIRESGKLPEEDKLTEAMSKFKDRFQPTEETAEALDLSIPAVKSRLLRARLQLRERLSRYFQKRESGDGNK